MNITKWLEALVQDLRYAARSLQTSPAFTAVAVLTLAIGIGATTAIFSAVNATLLRPLPFPNQQQLIEVRSRMTDGRVTSGGLSAANIWALKTPQIPITGIAGASLSPFEATLIRNDGQPVQVLLSVSDGRHFLYMNRNGEIFAGSLDSKPSAQSRQQVHRARGPGQLRLRNAAPARNDRPSAICPRPGPGVPALRRKIARHRR